MDRAFRIDLEISFAFFLRFKLSRTIENEEVIELVRAASSATAAILRSAWEAYAAAAEIAFEQTGRRPEPSAAYVALLEESEQLQSPVVFQELEAWIDSYRSR